MESATQLNLLKQRIIYDAKKFETQEIYEATLNRLLEDSKFIALSLRFPYQDYVDYDLPTKYNNWQLRCCVEIFNLIGTAGIKSYSENGLSWTRDSSYLSEELLAEIEPMVGFIETGE